MAQRSPLPTNIPGCRQILGGTHARKRRADSRCRNSLAQFFLSAGGSIRVSAVGRIQEKIPMLIFLRLISRAGKELFGVFRLPDKELYLRRFLSDQLGTCAKFPNRIRPIMRTLPGCCLISHWSGGPATS